MKSNDSHLYLHELSTDTIKDINRLDQDSKATYFMNLISRFYPNAEGETVTNLASAYYGSFMMEEKVRTYPGLAQAFTVVYTKTGLIREVVNDIYFLQEEYKYQIN